MTDNSQADIAPKRLSDAEIESNFGDMNPPLDRPEALVEADPFWPTGLRKSIQILEWTQVYVDGQKMI